MASLLPTLMDGAMGSLLISRGLPAGFPPDDWNITAPEKVAQAHQDYLDSGAQVILTNTFNTLQNLDSEWDLSQALNRLERGIQIARKVAENTARVFVSLAPGREPLTRTQARKLSACFNKADGVLLETCGSRRDLDTLSILQDSCQHGGITWGISFALQPDSGEAGQLADETPLKVMAKEIKVRPVEIFGLNCGRELSPSRLANSLRTLQEHCQAQWLIRANGGSPIRQAEGWVYPCTPESFIAWMQPFLDMQVSYLGGCCGIHPEHIRALRQSLSRRG